jgi:5,6,7,8-tetrahydromethanopterin hydro-lyase
MSQPTQFGEAFVGEGAEAAHLNTVLGASGGPVETAWVTALATPRAGHAGFVVAVTPGMAVRPFTLFVNKAAIADERHGTLTWGAAQAGVAGGVLDAVADNIIDPALADTLLLIAAVWVNPEARDEGAVYRNNREATLAALSAGRDRRPSVGEAVGARWDPRNAYFNAAGGAPGA